MSVTGRFLSVTLLYVFFRKIEYYCSFSGKEVKEEIPNRHLQRCGSLYLVFEYVEHDLGNYVHI